MPAFNLALNDLAQLAGDSEAAKTAVAICQDMLTKGISFEDGPMGGWLKSIQKRAGGNVVPSGQKSKDKKGKRGNGPKRTKS